MAPASEADAHDAITNRDREFLMDHDPRRTPAPLEPP